MKLLFFDDFKLGVVRDGTVIDVSAVVGDVPHTGPHDLINGLIARFAAYRPRLEEAARRERGVPLKNIRLKPPLPKPSTVVCMAVNYMEDGTEGPTTPQLTGKYAAARG